MADKKFSDEKTESTCNGKKIYTVYHSTVDDCLMQEYNVQHLFPFYDDKISVMVNSRSDWWWDLFAWATKCSSPVDMLGTTFHI